jgi:hypothetical protein
LRLSRPPSLQRQQGGLAVGGEFAWSAHVEAGAISTPTPEAGHMEDETKPRLRPTVSATGHFRDTSLIY